MAEDEELERLRRKRLLELQRRLIEEQERIRAQEEMEIRKSIALRHILTPEARRRLNALKMVKPELVSQLEIRLIELAQAGAIPVPLTDEQLKAILSKISSRRREIKIRRV